MRVKFCIVFFPLHFKASNPVNPQMSVCPDMLTNPRAGYAGREHNFKERIFKCRCSFAKKAILTSFFWQAGLSILCSLFLSLALSLSHFLYLSLSRARALSRLLWQADIGVLCTHFLSLSLSLSLCLTHISSLSLSPVFGMWALPPPSHSSYARTNYDACKWLVKEKKPGFSSFDPMHTILLKSVPTQAFAPQPDCRCTPPRPWPALSLMWLHISELHPTRWGDVESS